MLEICRRSSSCAVPKVVVSGVSTLRACFASSKNPNRHAMMYTLKGLRGRKIFKDCLKTGYSDEMLYLSAAENKSFRVDKLGMFGGSTPG